MSTTYTFEELAAAAASSNNIAEAVRKPGREPSPSRNRYVLGLMRQFGIDTRHFRRNYRNQVLKHGIDVSHMLGQAHARGTEGGRRQPDPAEILIADPAARGRIPTRRLRTAMVKIGIPYRCAMCDNGSDWHGHQITLEIDHISGDIFDNRPQNLRFLCPNCHATTPTFCRKKLGSVRPSADSLAQATGEDAGNNASHGQAGLAEQVYAAALEAVDP